MKPGRIIITGLVFLFLFFTYQSIQSIRSVHLPQEAVLHEKAKSDDLYQIVKVVDGDTITLLKDGKKQTIRLIGINTPETVDPRKPVECYGKEASSAMKELVGDRFVKVLSDSTQGDRDKYNRLLRYVYRDDGVFVNKYMITEGFAYEYTYDTPYEFQKEFREAQKKAETLEKGLWADGICGGK